MFKKVIAVGITGLVVMAGPAAAGDLRSAVSNLLGSVKAPTLQVIFMCEVMR